jgi:hypothetical protein
MTQEEILEYNKMCAEFLGVDINFSTEVYKDSKSTLRQYIHGKPKSEPLLFHSDWNWIMEVVEAIEKIYHIQGVEINGNCCLIKTYTFHKHRSETKKEAVVQAINKFLIWYNKNK